MKTDIEIAEEAAIEAGKIILSYYKSGYKIKEKGYKNPVTTADYESDNCIKKLLTEARPEYGWLSEETADMGAETGEDATEFNIASTIIFRSTPPFSARATASPNAITSTMSNKFIDNFVWTAKPFDPTYETFGPMDVKVS